jgi:hypothetical protein
MGMDLGSGMGAAPPSFYVAPQWAHLVQGGPGPFAQMPLPLPPPPLASVRVSALRHLFTDIPTAGAARGRGMLVDPARKAVWSGRGDDAVGMGVGRGKGTLERRLVGRRNPSSLMKVPLARVRLHRLLERLDRVREDCVQELFVHGHLDGDVRERLVNGFVGARLDGRVVF